MRHNLRRRCHELLEVGEDADAASRFIDFVLIGLIVVSVIASVIESIPGIRSRYATGFDILEMVCTAIFTVEYVLRVMCAVERDDDRFRRPVLGRLRYCLTPMALADAVAILPFYLGAWIDVDLRLLRILRLTRIFKLAHYFNALSILLDVIRQERNALGAAYFVVAIGLMLAASGVYVFEHAAQPDGFGSVAEALWWAIATLTTVGYGDVAPVTTWGRIFGSAVMLLGVGTVAIPTGILATGFALELRQRREIYDAELRVALEDGNVDPEERAHLEALQRALDLDSEQVKELEEVVQRLALRAPIHTCPHCGEVLDGAPAKPLTPHGHAV
ncbi:MAG: ion transporter [Myxococcales bacterium]|nr:ion transporter [Myxococcales bacterium]